MDEVAAIRAQIDHPIIDGDGHLLECMPWIRELLVDIADEGVARRLDTMSPSVAMENGHLPIRAFYGLPAENSLDRVTSMLPQLMYDRLEEFGIDYALLYPTVGLMFTSLADDELRVAGARAHNTYLAQAYGHLRDRLEPVAIIPTFTPEEAVGELNHAVGELGLKAIVMSGAIPRAQRPDGGSARWVDSLGHGSLYDYDPLWARCVELGVTPAFHGVGYGWGSRTSTRNYVYNHVGNFAAAQEAVCRSLVMGGVPQRFPSLHFTFLEGGVSWAVQLLADLIGHYEKRNVEAVQQFDPKRFSRATAEMLLDRHVPADDARREHYETALLRFPVNDEQLGIDDFAESQITDASDIVDIFSSRFSFGCEADDPLNALAFDRKYLPKGAQLNAVFASDIGHWDVPDMRGVLPEAWELVDHGLIDLAQFKAFTCDNVDRAMTATNPAFFDGTAVWDRRSR